MRKSEFKKLAEKSNLPKWYRHENLVLSYYRSCQYRWNDEETPDPQYDDISYHMTEDEAISAANSINISVGFRAIVERLSISYLDFNEAIEFGEEFELKDLEDKKLSIETEEIYLGPMNHGGILPESGFIVFYRHHQYLNYAYNIERIEPVEFSRLKNFSDLRNDSDSTSSTYACVVNNLDELAENFRYGLGIPFNKINKGQRIISEFLVDQKHPDFVG